MLGLPLRLLKGSGALLLIVLGGCGGRTSTLDPDAYGSPTDATEDGGTSAGGSGAKSGTATGGSTATGGNTTTGGSTATGGNTAKGGTGATSGGPSSGGAAAGSSASGAAGTAGEPAAGGASSGGASGSASGGGTGVTPGTFADCTNYCNIASQGPCPIGLSINECIWSCANELGSQTSTCQAAGSSLLSCLTTVYKNSMSCPQVEQLTLAKCSALGLSYQACATPTPDPGPTPNPGPPPPPSCSSAGKGNKDTCNVEVKCTSGAYYTVFCYESSGLQSSCSCTANYPDGSAGVSNFDLANESVASACGDALAVCGFPGAP